MTLRRSLDAAVNSINAKSSDMAIPPPREKGRLHVRVHLDSQMGLPMETRKFYALGLADGVAEWLISIYGRAATYESFMRIADKCIDPNIKGDPQPKKEK